MAYQNLGTVAWGSSPDITAVLAYDYRRSGSDMQYKVKITINTLPTSISTFGYPIYATIGLDGTTKVSAHQIKAASPSTWSSALVYETDWLTVTNKTSGTTKLSINLYSSSGDSRDKTYSYSLTVSPAASIPTAESSSVELGGSVRINTNRRDNTFYHRIGCKFGNYTHWGKNIFDDDIAQNWFLFSPPTSLASEIPNATSGTCTIYLATYSDAACTKKVGETQSMTLTLKVPTSGKPLISSLTLSDKRGYATTYGGYVQNNSVLNVVVNASGYEGSTIDSYTVVVDGVSYVDTSGTFEIPLPKAGTIKVKARVVDSRGRTSDYCTEQSITVLPYSAPAISALAVSRCNSDGTVNTSGTSVKVTFSGTISPLNDKNSATWEIEYRLRTGTTWTSVDAGVPAASKYAPSNFSTVLSDIAATSSAYVFRIAAKDNRTGTVYSALKPLSAAGVFFKIKTAINAFSLGTEETQSNTFLVKWKTELLNRLRVTADDSTSWAAAEFRRIGNKSAVIRFGNDSANLGCIGMSGEADGSPLYRFNSGGTTSYKVYDTGTNAPETVTATAETSSIKSLSATVKYFPMLGICFARIYFQTAASLTADSNILAVSLSGRAPTNSHALAVQSGRKISARVGSSGITIRPHEAVGSGWDVYVSGFWFA